MPSACPKWRSLPLLCSIAVLTRGVTSAPSSVSCSRVLRRCPTSIRGVRARVTVAPRVVVRRVIVVRRSTRSFALLGLAVEPGTVTGLCLYAAAQRIGFETRATAPVRQSLRGSRTRAAARPATRKVPPRSQQRSRHPAPGVYAGRSSARFFPRASLALESARRSDARMRFWPETGTARREKYIHSWSSMNADESAPDNETFWVAPFQHVWAHLPGARPVSRSTNCPT